MKAPANVVDLLAVAPFWLELIVQVCVEGIRTGKQSQDENGEGGVSGEFILILVRAISVTCFFVTQRFVADVSALPRATGI